MANYCTYCGSRVRLTDRFCTECGKKIPDAYQQLPPTKMVPFWGAMTPPRSNFNGRFDPPGSVFPWMMLLFFS